MSLDKIIEEELLKKTIQSIIRMTGDNEVGVRLIIAMVYIRTQEDIAGQDQSAVSKVFDTVQKNFNEINKTN